ncbi:MAG: HNH endonuclease [Bacteroidia bacterium]|nr:HNH endonuclease [Bacteroidia bacterium]
MEPLEKYLRRFKRLRIDRSHGGVAPHKPILLISVIQAYQNSLIKDNRVYITAELVALFRTNWTALVETKHDCRISYPFYYMKSEKFWTLVPKPGFENIDKMGAIMKSFSNLNGAVEYALLDEELSRLMQNKKTGSILQQFLLEEYFPKTKANFKGSNNAQLKVLSEIENKIFEESALEYRKEMEKLIEQKNEEEIYLRGNVFKREVPKIYNNTCCISGMRVDAITPVAMVDACHIVPFSVSYDDTITNGIALCPNLHRAFDRGLITIDEEYRVVISKSFRESESNYGIQSFSGKKILLPKKPVFIPSRENLEWHRNNTFK